MRKMCCRFTANFPWTTKIGLIGQKQPPRCACLSQEHCLWSRRNQVEIKQLAKLVGYNPEEIDGFLFNLSLRNYNDLLKPKSYRWDGCNVPLCYPYVCDRYMDIFDNRGNLRNPIHTRSLDSLLSLLQDYLNGDSPYDRKNSPIAYPYEQQGKHPSSIESEKVLSEDIEFSDLQSKGSSDWIYQILGSPKKSKSKEKTTSHREPQPVESPELGFELESEPQKDKMYRKSKAFGRHSVFLNDELALAYAKSYDYAEYLMKTMGRHRFRDSYIGPVGDLRTARTRILIRDLIARKGMNISDKDLSKALKKVDLEWKGSTRADNKREMKTAREISRLYNAIVQSPSDDSINWGIIGNVRENYPKVPKASKSPRKYFTGPDSLLFHEPFNQKKNRTGQRPHSRHSRLSPDYKLSSARIKRYINTSIKKPIEQVEETTSIYSARSDV
ncbi:uncharacterized protein LOC122614979 [Drosophila teissieri]|uniref:uncharacterized protein LOC122614979 n=1 Tax=Drosophila teissieri TaxID=7243 RepID=UPI001CBA376A|nr:uncharacterized protein LOC122614979 [Drosophila teissieri]